MNFEVVFNKKTYSFPEDLKEYIKLLDVVQKIENSLFNSFLSLTRQSDINVIDAAEMNSSFKNQASIFIEKLCSKDIYNKTIDDYAFNNEGYKEFERINQNALNAYAQFLSDEMSNYLAGMEQAEQNAASQITGSGIMVFTSSPLTLAATTAAEYSILKKQANKADEQYRRELAEVSRRGASEKDRKVNQYIVEHYYPEAKQAFEIFASVMLDRYLSDLISAGKFDKETYNYIDLKHSQNLLESLKISSNKEAILEQAFLACPFNPFVFVEASNLGLVDSDTYSTARVFNSDNAVRENLYDCLGEVSSDSVLSLEEKLKKADNFLPSLCAVNNRNKEYYYSEIGKPIYNKTINAYSIIQSDITDNTTCKKIISDFGEGFFDNSTEHQKTLINSYVKKRVKSIISNDDFDTLINKCGYNDLIEKIAPAESVESITKQNIDDYYINGFSKAISSLLKATEIEHKLHKQQEKEEKEQKEISKKNTKKIITVAIIVLLIVPVVINVILGVSWENKAKVYVDNLISERLETRLKNAPEDIEKLGGMPEYQTTKIDIYRRNGSFNVVPYVEYTVKNNVDSFTAEHVLWDVAEEYYDVGLKVPFYISFSSSNTPQIWGRARIFTPDGSSYYCSDYDNIKNDDDKHINPIISRQFIKFYLFWVLMLFIIFRKIQKVEFDLDLLVKNEKIKNKLEIT